MRANFLTDRNIFEEEEKIILNHLAIEGGKNSCCKKMELGISVSEDESLKEIMQSLLAKINEITDDEWLELQSCLPYDVTISDEDYK